MLGILIKNEFIKILRKGKTWLVFGLFLVAIVAMNVMSYMSEKSMKYYMSPAGQLEQIENERVWINDEIAYSEKQYKEKDTEQNKMRVEESKQRLVDLEERKKVQEERKLKGDSPDAWKLELAEQKKSHEETIADKNLTEDQKAYSRMELERIAMIENAGIKPLNGWEVDPFNNMRLVFMALGFIILVAGIAVFMSDIVSGESTPPTLKFLLVQPISRTKMILSKFIAITITVVTMIGGIELLNFLGLGMIKGFDGGKMPVMLGQKYKVVYEHNYPQITPIEGTAKISDMFTYIMQSFGLQILFIIACCALIFLISTVIKSSMITMAISVVATVGISILTMNIGPLQKISHLVFLNYGNPIDVFSGEIAYMYQNINFSPNLGAMLMIGTIIICPIIAIMVFNKKDILI
ncbi:MAG: ABC transporter permease subunit [Sarcina sp.]